MSDIRVVTRQNNYTAVDDNEFIAPRANRLGDLVSQDMYQQMVWDGRCFMASNAARETALAVGARPSRTLLLPSCSMSPAALRQYPWRWS